MTVNNAYELIIEYTWYGFIFVMALHYTFKLVAPRLWNYIDGSFRD